MEPVLKPCLIPENAGGSRFSWWLLISWSLVSPGEVTDGVTLYFSSKVTTFLVIVTIPTPLRFSTHRLSSVLCKFSRKKFTFIRVSPPGWCHPGQSASPSPPNPPPPFPLVTRPRRQFLSRRDVCYVSRPSRKRDAETEITTLYFSQVIRQTVNEMFVVGAIISDQIGATAQRSWVKKWPRTTQSKHEDIHRCTGVQAVPAHQNHVSSPDSHWHAYVQTTEYESVVFRWSTSNVLHLERFRRYCKFFHC